MNTFGRNISNGKITLKEADGDQSSLLVEIVFLKNPVKSREETSEKRHSQKLICSI